MATKVRLGMQLTTRLWAPFFNVAAYTGLPTLNRCTQARPPWLEVPRPSSLRSVACSAAALSTLATEVCSLKASLQDVPGPLSEELCDVLLAEGASSASVEEYRAAGATEQEIFAGGGGTPEARVWDRCTVLAHFPPEADAAAVVAVVAANFGLSSLPLTLEAVCTRDWEAAIRDSYQAVQIAAGLWIVPSWAAPPDPGATNIILEPGLAFGTGDHPTTRLCLRWLRSLSTLPGCHVMDYGTGSGVLAVAALLMGAARAVGTDVEPLAVKAAAQNARLSGVARNFSALVCSTDVDAAEPLQASGVGQDERLFDVVVANILQGPLLALAPRLASYARPASLLALSGILDAQAPAVIAAYSPYYDHFEVATEDRWALVTAVRRAH